MNGLDEDTVKLLKKSLMEYMEYSSLTTSETLLLRDAWEYMIDASEKLLLINNDDF